MKKIKVDYMILKGKKYWWQPSTKLRALGWRPLDLGTDLAAAVAKAEKQNELLKAWRNGDVKAVDVADCREKTLNIVIDRYLKSQKFLKKAEKTRDDYSYKLQKIREWGGIVPIKEITREDVQNLYDSLCENKSQRTGFAIIAVLRLVLQYAVNLGWLAINPAAKPGTEVPESRDVVWSKAEEKIMIETADEMGYKAFGTAIYFAAYLGQREGDLRSLNWNAYAKGYFKLKQHKTKRIVEVPAHPELKKRINSLIPEVGGIIIKADFNGQQMSQGYFSHTFSKIRKKAAEKLPSCARLKFLDLRRTAVVRLAEAGCTEFEISAVTGHKIETCRQILETYLPRTTKMAENAIRKLTINGE